MNMQEQQPKQRIDMAHGFIKSVIRNQIDRDNYDKEVKAKQQHGKFHMKPHSHTSKQKKPEIQTYIPPQRSKKELKHLYILEYEHKDGEVFPIHVAKTDIPEEVAKVIGEKFDLPEAFVDALAQQIHKEMLKRTI
ncbi:UPF0561 protein C2orf68 homolog [Physella acuta]|uniref:UPF0561 protein C2orf68 homolog n=1 Tax=Physella acuta TaxID=109671 RepID=UPI0027DE9529|nr:UPF0561 protein C2orf68 homolog [Physella acuta]